MLMEQIEKNRRLAFERLAERKNADTATVKVDGNSYSYTTKRGKVKNYTAFNSFSAYRKSALYSNAADKVNGFLFVEIKESL